MKKRTKKQPPKEEYMPSVVSAAPKPTTKAMEKPTVTERYRHEKSTSWKVAASSV